MNGPALLVLQIRGAELVRWDQQPAAAGRAERSAAADRPAGTTQRRRPERRPASARSPGRPHGARRAARARDRSAAIAAVPRGWPSARGVATGTAAGCRWRARQPRAAELRRPPSTTLTATRHWWPGPRIPRPVPLVTDASSGDRRRAAVVRKGGRGSRSADDGSGRHRQLRLRPGSGTGTGTGTGTGSRPALAPAPGTTRRIGWIGPARPRPISPTTAFLTALAAVRTGAAGRRTPEDRDGAEDVCQELGYGSKYADVCPRPDLRRGVGRRGARTSRGWRSTTSAPSTRSARAGPTG